MRPLAITSLLLVALAGCTTAPEASLSPQPTSTSPIATDPPVLAGPRLPEATDTPQDVLTDLTTPWGLAFLPEGAVLVTLRDPAEVLLLTTSGSTTLTGPGAAELVRSTVTAGEGGLLGVAVSPEFPSDGLVYLYRTTAGGNEVVRGRLDGLSRTLGELETVIGAIPAAGNHNGGRIAFGPDGMLYVATGDAGNPSAAQVPETLAGKILRLTPDGDPAPGNPGPGPVWSQGHRNVQGMGWDDQGRMFASEFGQNTFDELNLIEAGSSYGWPQVEGRGDQPGLVDPLFTWPPSEASPSGIAVTEDGVYLAALRGQRLWFVGFADSGFVEPRDVLVGELGRLRDVVQGPDGALWILTQNTDGRGTPRPGDDRLVRLRPP